jgi:sporulation protein YlmC with PRC-barrel domain
MPAFEVVRRWKGRIVLDRDGQHIGSVEEIYYDPETDQPGWALLDLGEADGTTSLVPLAEATEWRERIHVPYDRVTVLHAPGMPPTRRLWPQDEAALYSYYNLDYTWASIVDRDELDPGDGGPDSLGDTVRVGFAPRWLLNADGPSLS